MGKVTFKPGTMVNPVPVVMVSCGETEAERNITTIAWTGIVNSEPPMTYISVRKSRHSHDIIEKRREFVINLCTEELAFQTDYCGVKSGRDVDKFKEQKLTPIPAQIVKCPMIQESPVNIECKVKEIHHYPSHDMFVAEIVAVHADDSLMTEKGKLELERADLICFSHGDYYGIKKVPLGKFGFSVMKPKTKKRIDEENRKNNRKARKGAGAASAERPARPANTSRNTAGKPTSYGGSTAGKSTNYGGSTTGKSANSGKSTSSYGNKSTGSGGRTEKTFAKPGNTASGGGRPARNPAGPAKKPATPTRNKKG